MHLNELPMSPLRSMTIRERKMNIDSVGFPYHNPHLKDESDVFTFEFWTSLQSEGELKDIFICVLLDEPISPFRNSLLEGGGEEPSF